MGRRKDGDLIPHSELLRKRYPGLIAASWYAQWAGGSTDDLPSLQTAGAAVPQRRATNMTEFFRQLGAKGRSPVEFQIQKAREGTLAYSRRSVLVDYLLYLEVWSGYLIGLHDCEALGKNMFYGLAQEAHEPSLAHISGKALTIKPDEPVLITDGRIFASLRHGPDRETCITSTTRKLWGVMFATPQDDPSELDVTLAQIREDGLARGIWTLDGVEP
jgi:hypothetical protein